MTDLFSRGGSWAFFKVLGITALSKDELRVLVISGRRDLWRHLAGSEAGIGSKSHEFLEILPISFISWSPVTTLNSEKTELALSRSSFEWEDCLLFSLFRQAPIICKFFVWLARWQKFPLDRFVNSGEKNLLITLQVLNSFRVIGHLRVEINLFTSEHWFTYNCLSARSFDARQCHSSRRLMSFSR